MDLQDSMLKSAFLQNQGENFKSTYHNQSIKLHLADFAIRDRNYNLCLEMLHLAIKLGKVRCTASIFEAAFFEICDNERIFYKKSVQSTTSTHELICHVICHVIAVSICRL